MSVSITSVAEVSTKPATLRGMDIGDAKDWRVVPGLYAEGTDTLTVPSRRLSATWDFQVLREALERETPTGLGLVLPFSWQMHWYAYTEASKRGIRTAVAMPSNTTALVGLMRSMPIDAVLTNDLGARALERDLQQDGLLQDMKLWVVLSSKEAPSDFSPKHGKVIHATLP